MLVSKIREFEENLCVCDEHSNSHTSVYRDDENSCAVVDIICREIPTNAAG